MSESQTALEVRNLNAGYSGPKGYQVVEDVSFELKPRETLGIVGESGCGKSTIARAVMKLIDPNAGRVFVGATEFSALRGNTLRNAREQIQMVFQDPFGSLDPRMSVLELVEQPLKVHGRGTAAERADAAKSALARLGIGETLWDRRPTALSGGQRQRVAIARATAITPVVTVLDEAVSALDVSVQAQVLNLLRAEQEKQGLAYLFIVHDLSIAAYFCDRILVLYMGRVMEEGPAEEVFATPQHPYTAALISASPERGSGRDRVVLRGEPQGRRPEVGCPFAARCPISEGREICSTVTPELRLVHENQRAACHFAGELAHLGVPAREDAAHLV